MQSINVTLITRPSSLFRNKAQVHNVNGQGSTFCRLMREIQGTNYTDGDKPTLVSPDILSDNLLDSHTS
jgi:hypothetical protein